MGIIILTAQTGGSRFGAAVGAVHPFHAFHSPGHPWNAPRCGGAAALPLRLQG